MRVRAEKQLRIYFVHENKLMFLQFYRKNFKGSLKGCETIFDVKIIFNVIT